MPRITPSLWFDTRALEAAEFYCSIFADSRIDHVVRQPDDDSGEPGAAVSVHFSLDGAPFAAINGGPQFDFTEAVSFAIECADQSEIDRYWYALTDGGEEGRCGWLKDRFGLSWQVVPSELGNLLGDPDPQRAQRSLQAMLTMSKIDVAAIRTAAEG